MDAQKILSSFLDGRTVLKVEVVTAQENTDEEVIDSVVLWLEDGIKITFSGARVEIEKCDPPLAQ